MQWVHEKQSNKTLHHFFLVQISSFLPTMVAYIKSIQTLKLCQVYVSLN